MREGSIVLIKSSMEAFGEGSLWEEHYFLVHEVAEDLVTGTALTGTLAGEYGEPSLNLIKKVYNEVTN